MINQEQDHELLRAQGDSHLIPTAAGSAPPSGAEAPPKKMGFGQKVIVAILLTVVVIPPTAGFYSYFSGVPLHLLASTKDKDKEDSEDSTPSAVKNVSLVPGKPHTLEVPGDVAAALGIRKGQREAIVEAKAPTMMRPLVLPGSTALDPTRLDRIRARFAPARVVELAKVWDRSDKNGHTEFRELRSGDTVSKGDRLGIFYSVDVGSKKNDLLDALVQLELDQKILDGAEKHAEAVPPALMNTYLRAVQGDRNAINRALNNLKLWDIPQDEIDALHAEAKKLSADKNAWLKTPEGRWVKGEKQSNGDKAGAGAASPNKETENPWGRVALYADFDGVVVERNVHVGEMVVDNTVNLFQIADVSRMLVIASCPEDALPILESLHNAERRWTIQTVGAPSAGGLPGTIDEIGFVIDPNQHTAVIKGYVENPGRRLRAGQYVTATVSIPPPPDVVEIPTNALVDDGLQSLVFVQPKEGVHEFTMRRVQVTHRFAETVFVRSTPLPKEEQLTEQEAEEGLLPKEPLRPGERVLLAGSVELKAAVIELESRPEKKPDTRVARAKTRSVSELESPSEKKPKMGKS